MSAMRGLVLLAIGACGSPPVVPVRAVAVAAPARCTVIAPGTALRDAARVPGARLCLAPGRHEGPIVLAPHAIVWGPPAAVIDRREGGTVVEVGTDAAIEGVTLDGRGGIFDREDAAVRLAGDGARVEGVTIVDAVFGVLAERVARVTIRGNRI
ncbi:MAG TPA: hypothetical protein VIV58_19220, partial [Kofleriaceae bacterium]